MPLWNKIIAYVFVLVMAFGFQGAQAQDAIFTIKDVKVDVTAQSAAAAREKAFQQAQGQAFAILSSRMLSGVSAQGFIQPSPNVISGFIKDFEITSERLSDVRYIGTYTFRFKDRPIRDFFRGISQSSDEKSEPVLILPFYQEGDKSILWSPDNIWMQAWRDNGDLVGVVPMVLPLGDRQDIRYIAAHEALNYNPEKLDRMARRYRASDVILTIAVPDPVLSLIENVEDEALGFLSVYLYRTDSGEPEFLDRVTVAPQGQQTRQELYDSAVLQVQEVLKQRWKERANSQIQEINSLALRAHFTSFPQWAKIQSALEGLYGVDEVNIKSLSSSQALIQIVFDGSERRLRLALSQAGLTLTTPRINMKSLTSGDRGQGALIYDLYLQR